MVGESQRYAHCCFPVVRFLYYFQVDSSERENLQNKVKEAQIQLQVAREALSKYRERENELRADEVSMGKQLVCATPCRNDLH